MNREELLNIVSKAELKPLIDQEENPGSHVGWYKSCTEPIPILDELMKNPSATVTVERRQVANFYLYIVRCPLDWA